ncbi:MAG: FoF1 ATP synthase subunit a [Candidatus Calescibacterium sp.]|nr:F0F1 ATP synthase subunit A [Candidatus Calescibacterium sp.]MCX7971641.1 F0F1 ATP synthase subunit A [bacterium]MDW8195849.1 FoF1 ATP synthase subunit a [Candidatus Calescibacterium sp.]
MFLGSFIKYNINGIEIHLNTIVSTWIVMAIILFFGVLYRISVLKALKELKSYPYRSEVLIPKPISIQNIFEMIIEAINNINHSVLGARIADRYMILLVSYFIFILFSNLFGYIPPILKYEGQSLLVPPTSDLSTTLALTVVSVVSYNLIAVRETGLKNWLEHFIFPIPYMFKISKEKFTILIGIILLPLFFLLNIVDIFARTLSLSLRLFANIFSEHLMVEKFVGQIVESSAVFIKIFLYLLTFFVMFLGLAASIIQALIFEVLSAIYISLYLPHEESH